MIDYFKLRFYLDTLCKYLLSYAKRRAVKQCFPVHVVFCAVDHYEPGWGGADSKMQSARLEELENEYPKLAKNHRDSFGSIPKRTWFFPPHDHTNYSLKRLVALCEKGYGEIELHLHHGKSQPDTSDHLELTIKKCIEEYSIFGIFGTSSGRKRYGFVHGDWALDNSRGGKFCGVNNEIDILIRTGCYADFTFPSNNEANPAQINSIYYARNGILGPKSYNKGISVKRFCDEQLGLMMIQGPLCPVKVFNEVSGWRIVGDSLNETMGNRRINAWVKTGIHFDGRNDVVFVKTHLHGAPPEYKYSSMGEGMNFVLNYLENNFNDGSKYLLHYVTAREMFNIIKGLEAGKDADEIGNIKNYEVGPPEYDSSPDIREASDDLKMFVSKTYK